MTHTKVSLSATVMLLLACTVSSYAQQKLSIDAATVFINGAELVSSAKVALAKGENEIIFTNVAGNVNTHSRVVNATNGPVVEDVIFKNNYLASEQLSPKAAELKDSVDLVWAARQEVKDKIDALAEQVAILRANRKVSGDNSGLSVAELTKLLDLVNSRMEGILNQQRKEEARLKRMDDHVTKLKKQLKEEQQKAYQPGGQLLVKFYAKEEITSAVTINYIVPNAGWSPTYDIMADNVNSPVKLYYKANIYQNSGVQWNNVRLSLSTGNPNEGMQAPMMYPWYLAFYVKPMVDQDRPMSMNAYKNSERFSSALIRREADSAIIMDPVSGEDVYTTMNEHVSVDNAGVNTSFDIDLPYTIPSDGQQHLVAIKKYELPATYRYYAAPKLDKDAFLQAQITNWEDLNLLPGQTNIFYEGTYVGQGAIDVRNVKDTMTISLGRDKKIVVKRERDSKLRSVKTIGSNIREEFAYSITVRNARKESINLVIQDQQPVSNDKDIVIEDRNTGDAEYKDTTGMMKWTLALNPNEAKSVTFGYTVKYPRGRTVENLR